MSKTTISSFVNNENWCIPNAWPMMLKEKITSIVISPTYCESVLWMNSVD
ncbi:hypothetical protein KFK09_007357 [Dendrobium nobile]|uniref:Uncharacterized protein n=1 Tax=Dendrobium nobile TaxID=94219 RepID=A0A8T3BUZ0_DENNO|nr:hypothetical protein KFK09_007357 [Dendrobium nobile]